jgi:hypothetical protein
MTTQPNSSFPLLASDQEEVVRIFIERMDERSHAASGPEKTTVNKSLESQINPHGSWPSELLDSE